MMRILFVCTGNICRSPMAEVLLRRALQEHPRLKAARVAVRSAGTSGWDGAPATGPAVEVMRRRGLDLTGHRAQPLTRELVAWADLLLTMEAWHRDRILGLVPGAAGKVFPLSEYAGGSGDIADPYGEDETAYTHCADRLAACLPGLLGRLRSGGDGAAGTG